MYEPAEITQITFLDGFHVQLNFINGATREIDLEPYLHGPIFEPMRTELAAFQEATVTDGTITWPNGADIDPDVLYLGLQPNASEEEWQAAVAAENAKYSVS
ncbi:MAG: hypothetical protein GFH27_549413n19 [Chloroflexi bacterium AL-W]|nr:hypothetical protein [Chloroflexi bacterium AL-N1]NOK71417.1 hypothetical protein [Chloroflexi bacterium AL-N10]NOK78820.1 hypothetical protein [Chloroflexi bacterium AL-N5]NOK86238.1 hypothetical protein [Chloroflexi bacterium AL-W]NOK93142.1 hypothetical protein [Chloroflexi bacterium AL-N15]